MLSKAHLTSHSRMSGSQWVITPSWLSGSWRCFLCSSSVYSCHLFLISSASVRSIPFLTFIEPIFAWNVPLVSLIFLKRSLVFPTPLFSSISLHWPLRKTFLSLLAILHSNGFIYIQNRLHDPDNNNSVIIHREPDILECEVKWALGSITMIKASGGDGIPVELFQILKDDAGKVLHSICQQIWKTQQWPQDWKDQFSSQSQRKTMPKNVQTTAQLRLSHTLAE